MAGVVKVDFVVRSDSATKKGGDDLQVQQYADRLRQRGVEVKVIPFSPSLRLRKGAIVHITNVDRPFELLETVQRCAGRPFVITPIHHNSSRVRQMRRAERGRGVRSLVDRHSPDVVREWLAVVVRTIRDRTGRTDWRSALGFLARSSIRASFLRRALSGALDRALSVALLAEGEGRDLQMSTGWGGANSVVIPNGQPRATSQRQTGLPWADRARGIVMVGRVEPRKRQLDAAKLAARRGIEVTIIGDLQSVDAEFGNEFIEVVEASDRLHYLGPLTHEQTLRVLAETRVLLNASWVEVQSLVDIEAASMGCFVAATPAGHSSEWLAEQLFSVDDLTDVDGLLRLALELTQSADGPPPLVYTQTWEHAAEQLLSEYSRAPNA